MLLTSVALNSLCIYFICSFTSLFSCTVGPEYYFIGAQVAHVCVCGCVCVFVYNVECCAKIAVGTESESECCRSCCYRSHSSPQFSVVVIIFFWHCCCHACVFLWSNICVDNDRGWRVPPCNKSPKVTPLRIWLGRRHNEYVLRSVCGNADRQSHVYTQIYACT